MVKEILSRHVSFVREKSAGPTRGHSCHSPRTEPGSNPPHCGPSLSRGQSSSPCLGFSGRAPGRSSAAGKKRRPTRRNPVPSRAPQEARQAPEHPSFRQRLPGPPPPRGGPLRTPSERGGLPGTLGRGAVDPVSGPPRPQTPSDVCSGSDAGTGSVKHTHMQHKHIHVHIHIHTHTYSIPESK